MCWRGANHGEIEMETLRVRGLHAESLSLLFTSKKYKAINKLNIRDTIASSA